MNTDFHIHSSLSADSDSPMEDMIEQGIRLGLDAMCFTEHMDFGYVDEGLNFELDTDTYYETFQAMKERYEGKIRLLFGVELGLQPHLAGKHRQYLSSYPFDFCIGSSHLVDGIDPYYPKFYEGRREEECYRRYFASILENLDAFSHVDSYGHIDYVVRYGPNKNTFYSYERYRDLIDEILKTLIEKGIALEVNTAGYKYGLGAPNPHPDILKKYRSMGGELLTVGSDAHRPEHLAYDFQKVTPLLKECGFKAYTVFEKRVPKFLPL